VNSSGSAPEQVRANRVGRTLVLVLDSPPLNVFSRGFPTLLLARFEAVRDDHDVRVVVLTSASERAFSAGANIREMSQMGPAEAHDLGNRGQALTRAIERLPLPVIAAVNGVCYGGGFEVALACDFIVASTDARFGLPEVDLGIVTGWGGIRRLVRRIGPMRARRWIYTGPPVSAADAQTAGVVDLVVPRAELLPASLTLANELASKPPLALAAAKYALLAAIDPQIDRGLSYELGLWTHLFGTETKRERMEAFLSKSKL
jgi:enoyl-CoA hydratase